MILQGKDVSNFTHDQYCWCHCTHVFYFKSCIKIDFKIALVFGLLFYIVGYSGITYLNQFSLLILFMMIATIGEIVYSPIFEEQRFKIIPEDKRGTYSAFHALGIHMSETLARLGLSWVCS